jgi:hypothetical protein
MGSKRQVTLIIIPDPELPFSQYTLDSIPIRVTYG